MRLSKIGTVCEALALESDGERTLCVLRDGTEIYVKGSKTGVFNVTVTKVEGEMVIGEPENG